MGLFLTGDVTGQALRNPILVIPGSVGFVPRLVGATEQGNTRLMT